MSGSLRERSLRKVLPVEEPDREVDERVVANVLIIFRGVSFWLLFLLVDDAIFDLGGFMRRLSSQSQ